jgi:molybdopterin-guanine dinucleotide biosynthesis protein MobB
MVAFGFYGSSKSGKTSTIARITAALRKKGYSVVAIKHTHLDVRVDESAEDTKRLRDVGALCSALSAKEQSYIVFDRPLSAKYLLKMLEPLCDVVLVEGFRDAGIKKFAFGNTDMTDGTLFRYSDDRFEEVLELIEEEIRRVRCL